MSSSFRARRRPTIEDVAKRAGVSRQTVSRAINAKGEISPATRELVMEAIDELGYRPNRLAQGMVTRRTRTVALVAGDIRNPFFGEVAHGAGSYLAKYDHKLLILDTDEDAGRELSALRDLSHDVDGIIAFLYHSDLDELRSIAELVPALVVLNREVPLEGARVVSVDLVDAGRQVARHLLYRGHRHVAVVHNATQPLGTSRRVRGFVETFEAHGGSPVVRLVAQPTMQGGVAIGPDLVQDHPEVTAVFAYNDLVAAGVAASVRREGRSVPGDLAVVGCDDIAIAATWDPPLTTVRIGAENLGALAAQHALELLGVSVPPADMAVLGVQLVERDST